MMLLKSPSVIENVTKFFDYAFVILIQTSALHFCLTSLVMLRIGSEMRPSIKFTFKLTINVLYL